MRSPLPSSLPAWLASLVVACGSSAHPAALGDAPAGGDGGPPPYPNAIGGGGGGNGGTPAPPGVCSPSPGNFDVPGNGCDDDGDGKVDNPPACDDGSLPVGGTAAQLLKSMGLCQFIGTAADPRWGVLSANLYAGYGAFVSPNPAQSAILPAFGDVVVPREGRSFGVLSSGYARAYDSLTGATPFKGLKTPMQGGTADAAPPGYPKSSPGCPLLNSATFDLVDLKIQIKVPLNALGFSFDFDFWSGEWPEYVCTPYNDTFIAYLHSKAFNNGLPANVSFDAKNDAVSVNNGFFDRCTPDTETGCSGTATKAAACPGGPGELAGTGFYDFGAYCGKASTGGGATGWLTSSAPVAPLETITLEFMIWDTGDPNWDSSVLVDHFAWAASPVSAGTVRPK